MLTNADSLLNKLKELELLCYNEKPDLIAVTEVKPKNTRSALQSVDIQIEGYNLVDMLDHGSRGLCIYYKHGLSCTQVTRTNNSYRDAIWIDVQDCRIGLIYRSPTCNQLENDQLLHHLEEMADKVKGKKELILLGDFNLPGINWETLQSSRPRHHPSTRLLECFLDHNLTQHVTRPTRWRDRQVGSILDLILSSKDDLVDDIEYLPHLGESDHCVLVTHILTKLEAPEIDELGKTSLNWEKANFPAIRGRLGESDLASAIDEMEVEEAWSVFKEGILSAAYRYTPKRKSSNPKAQKKPLWANPKSLKKVRRKREAFRRYLQTGEGEDYLKYQVARREAKRETRLATIMHEQQISLDARRNSKRFWAYSKRKCKKRDSIPNLKSQKGCISSDQEKAEEFNKFFTSVFTKEEDNIPSGKDPGTVRMEDIIVSEEEIIKLLTNLDVNKATGPDGVPTRLLKETAHQVAAPLKYIFQKSLDTGMVPGDWKKATVCPIHKKGDKCNVENYRPVSLTSVVCKVLESLVRGHINNYLAATNKMSSHQFGFMQGRSSVENMLLSLEDWTRTVDEGGAVDILFLDFKKAFDSVPHRRLVEKVRSIGLSDQCRVWIESFLTGRSQQVRIGDKLSKEEKVTSGVPQGSVIGPTLFTIFINDLPDNIKSQILMFADDVKLYRAIKNISDCRALQHDLDMLHAWSLKWQLNFNPQKCQLLRLGKVDITFNYTIGNSRIQECNEAKDLGVLVQKSLKPDLHIHQIAAKATKVAFTIKRTMNAVSKFSGKLLFTALVRPIMEYGAAAWCPMTAANSAVLEKVQRRYTKHLPGLYNTPYEERLRILDLFSLRHRRLRGDMILLYRLFQSESSLIRKYLVVNNIHNTRGHSRRLKIVGCNTNIRRNFFILRAAKEWNALPQDLVRSANVGIFKRGLDSYWKGRKDPFQI